MLTYKYIIGIYDFMLTYKYKYIKNVYKESVYYTLRY